MPLQIKWCFFLGMSAFGVVLLSPVSCMCLFVGLSNQHIWLDGWSSCRNQHELLHMIAPTCKLLKLQKSSNSQCGPSQERFCA